MARKPKRTRQEYIDYMTRTGGWSKIGRKGGERRVARYGSEDMARIGRMGGEALMGKFDTPEELKTYYSNIGKKSRKEDAA